MQASQNQSSSGVSNDLLGSYQARVAASDAHSDEMLAPDGSVKPVWSEFFAHLSGLSPERLERRFARGDEYLRDAGVLYRQYDETLSSEREWPLTHIPVLIGESEWRELSTGLIERADLLEHVLRDFYGDNAMVAAGQLPATLLSQNPAWLRPMVGCAPQDTTLLNNVSFEIGRGPDGKWWVISDLIEAPSTMGFAVENRIAMSRAFPNFFKDANIYRLAGFFHDIRKRLGEMAAGREGEIALLTPGPLNQHYAEHAYLARYLGLLLVEGEDLIVHDGRAMVRTIAGPKPISLLWNRLPGRMFDPLELESSSMLGTPGLVQAVRDGAVQTVNMVGAGVLETRALMAFLPRIARDRLGRGLALSNIATWWCGQPAQRDHVVKNAHRMMVGNAFSTTPLMADPSTIAPAGDGPQAKMLAEMLEAAGRDLVGQEAVTLSTTPVFEGGELVPRPMCVRISLTRTADGWSVMPGGYARISGGDDAKALAMQRGGKVADVWVTSDRPVPTPTLLSDAVGGAARARAGRTLPSRAADNLFWVGRYVERAEFNMRLFRASFARLSDGAKADDPLPEFLRTDLMAGVAADAAAMADKFSKPLKAGLQAATRISDRFSPDGMMALRGLVREMRDLDDRHVPLDDIPFEISRLLRLVTGFSGLVHENMYRSDGWRFMSLGVSLERAANMCTVLAACVDEAAPSGALDLALEIGDSSVTHRALHQVAVSASSVIDLLALDPSNPRSVRYHVSRARDHIAHLPNTGSDRLASDVARKVLMTETSLATALPDDVTAQTFIALRQDIWDLSSATSAQFLA